MTHHHSGKSEWPVHYFLWRIKKSPAPFSLWKVSRAARQGESSRGWNAEVGIFLRRFLWSSSLLIFSSVRGDELLQKTNFWSPWVAICASRGLVCSSTVWIRGTVLAYINTPRLFLAPCCESVGGAQTSSEQKVFHWGLTESTKHPPGSDFRMLNKAEAHVAVGKAARQSGTVEAVLSFLSHEKTSWKTPQK